MPMERFAMRQVREVIRLKSAGVPTREIARRVGTAPSTVRLTIHRFEAAGLTWPLPDDITDAALEARLFASAGAGPGTRRGHRRQAGLGGGTPRTPAQACDAVDPVGRVHRRRTRRVSLFALCCGQIYVVAAGVSHGFRRPPWLAPQHKSVDLSTYRAFRNAINDGREGCRGGGLRLLISTLANASAFISRSTSA
ncbi:hypothetical protein ACVWZM_004790 [Bradyrhizobium sp. USDA 4501]